MTFMNLYDLTREKGRNTNAAQLFHRFAVFPRKKIACKIVSGF